MVLNWRLLNALLYVLKGNDLMKYFKSFKNNNAPQNLFLFALVLAFIASILSLNWQALIAWGCCFVAFVMFCGERDHNRFLTEELKEIRSANISKAMLDEHLEDKDQI